MALGPIGGPIGGRPQHKLDSTTQFAQISFTGTATMAVDADLAAAASVAFDGVATMEVEAVPAVTQEAEVAYTGAATMAIEGLVAVEVSVDFTGAAAFLVEAYRDVAVSVDYSGVATMFAHPASITPPVYSFTLTAGEWLNPGPSGVVGYNSDDHWAFPASFGSIDQEPFGSGNRILQFVVVTASIQVIIDGDIWSNGLLEHYGLFIDGVHYKRDLYSFAGDATFYRTDTAPVLVEGNTYLVEWRPQAARFTGSASLSVTSTVTITFTGDGGFFVGEIDHASVAFTGEADMDAFAVKLHEVSLTYFGEGTMQVAGGSAFMNLLEDPNARRIFTVELDPRLIP